MAQIDKPNLHFNTVLYTGNASTQAVTGVGFQPDWLWIKNRSTTNAHNIFDAVRGTNKKIDSSESTAENASATNLTSFDTDGFTLASNAGTNGSGNSLVSWNWKANGQGSSNTSGTINTTYTSANTTAGFSICTWTGTGSAGTIGHGLGAVPKLMLIKNLSSAESWRIYHPSLGNATSMKLNTTDTSFSDTGAFNSTTPTSTLFTVGNSDSTNKNGDSMVAYVFAEKTGYSKMSSYKGNGNSTNGPFVYTGFKPAFVIGKKTNGNSDNWYMLDNKRIGYNEDNYWLYPNLNNSEYGSDQSNHTAYHADLLSNGFKLRSSDDMVNGNGNTYVFWAFAENPIVGSNNVPAVAR